MCRPKWFSRRRTRARNPKSTKQSSTSAPPASAEQLLDELVTGPMTTEGIQDTFLLLKKARIERALGAELPDTRDIPPGSERRKDATNQRKGKSSKPVLTNDGPPKLDIPRNRMAAFPDPHFQARAPVTGFDDKIVAMCARDMCVSKIRMLLDEQYGTDCRRRINRKPPSAPLSTQ